MIRSNIKEAANGQWFEILNAAGIPAQHLDGRGHSCPRCGGTDRFSTFKDTNQTGGVICRKCFAEGNGDGLATLQWLMGVDYSQALEFVTQHLGASVQTRPLGKRSKDSFPKATPKESFVTSGDAVEALDRSLIRRGMKRTDQFNYHDSVGKPVAIVVRYEDERGGKTFRPISKHGGTWKLADPSRKWPLYGLRHLGDGARAQPVFVVEGEKCVEALRTLDLTAVTSAHGSGSPHKSDWTTMRHTKHVAILPDNDDPGRKYAKTVAGILAGLGVTVSIVELPGLPPSGDIVDWIQQGGESSRESLREELLEHVEMTEPLTRDEAERPDRRAKLVRMSDVEPEAVSWLWPNRIALGKLTLISGDPGLGKSFVTLDMAARITTGCVWPDAPSERAPKGSAVFLSAEDDPADTIRPRLDAAGADCDRVYCLQAVQFRTVDDLEQERSFSLTHDLEVLESTLREVNDCRLIVVDPITAYLGGVDSHRNAEIRSVLQPLSDLAAKYEVAVVAVTHMNKCHGGPAIYRSMGSLAFTAAARAVWAVSRDPDDQRRRLVLPVKNNVAADGSGLAYRIAGEPPRVEWEADPVALTADDALAPAEEREERSERERARDWLREALAAGPVPSLDMRADAEELGFSLRTLQRAFRDIKGTAKKNGPNGGWMWSV